LTKFYRHVDFRQAFQSTQIGIPTVPPPEQTPLSFVAQNISLYKIRAIAVTFLLYV